MYHHYCSAGSRVEGGGGEGGGGKREEGGRDKGRGE